MMHKNVHVNVNINIEPLSETRRFLSMKCIFFSMELSNLSEVPYESHCVGDCLCCLQLSIGPPCTAIASVISTSPTCVFIHFSTVFY